MLDGDACYQRNALFATLAAVMRTFRAVGLTPNARLAARRAVNAARAEVSREAPWIPMLVNRHPKERAADDDHW
jgi:hypothetical protein